MSDDIVADLSSVEEEGLRELERVVAVLHERGVDFTVEHGQVIVPKVPTDQNRETTVDLGKDHIRLGIVSDTHGGSKFEQLTALRAFYKLADEREVDAFVHVGDWTQGPDKMHRDAPLSLHAHGADAQVDYVVATFPRSSRGIRTYGITGNHDDAFLNESGTNVVRRIAEQRDDIIYCGQDAAYLNVGPLRMYLLHPEGGGAYAKSYKGQKLSEALPIERNVALELIGHYHNWVWFRQQRAVVIQLPAFQAQYAWLARKGLHPDIGGIVADFWLNREGFIARMLVEPVFFPALERDWDHAASDAVSYHWSPEMAA